MAITITKTGSEISTEKYVVTAVSNDPLVTSVNLYLHINGTPINHTINHLPKFGTTDTFDFEINSIIKDYFNFDFLPLTGVNQTVLENVLVGIEFNEVIGSSVGGASYRDEVVIKNMTQDAFQIEDFDLADYDCGDAGSTLSKLLTSSPNPLPVGDKTSLFVSCLTTSYDGGLLPKQEWIIETFLDGVLVTSIQEDVTVPTRGITGYITDGKYDISNYRFDFNSADGYDEVRFYIRDIASPFTSRSETRSYKLNDACEKAITLSWYNELGAQDTFTFLGNITRTGKYTDSTFKRTRPVNPLSTDVGDLVYKSSFNYEYDIFSDRMPENDVQWLSNILINKRAAIQTESTGSVNRNGFLYNWFAIDNGNEADGTTNGGIVNQSQTGWHVPSGGVGSELETLFSFVGGANSGGLMKTIGLTDWNSPNTGATNAFGFDGVGSGYRFEIGGTFSGLKLFNQMLTYSLDSPTLAKCLTFNYNNVSLGQLNLNVKRGMCLRLVRVATGGENSGDLIPNAYTGNNGDVYDGIVIGTQVWLKRNLTETKYNDGTDIPNVVSDSVWENLSTGAFSVYDNGKPTSTVSGKYFPIVITTEETVLEDKFTPETLFRLKFRLANKRKGLK